MAKTKQAADSRGVRRDKPNKLNRNAAPKPTPPKPSQRPPKIKTIKTRPQTRKRTKRAPSQTAPELSVIKGGVVHKRVRKLLAFCITIAAVAGLVFLQTHVPGGLIEWTMNAAAGIGGGDGYPVTLSGGLGNGLTVRGGDVYVLSESAVSAYNTAGRLVFSRTHGFADPVTSVSRSRLLTYDRGGLSFRVDNKIKKLFSQKTDNTILAGAIGDDGTFAIAQKSKGYVSQVEVFTKGFEKRFTWYSVKYQVTSLAVAPDGEHIAVSVIGASGGAYISTVYLFNLSQKKPIAEIAYPDNFLFHISYQDDGHIVAVGDRLCSALTKDGKKVRDFSFGSYKLDLLDTGNTRQTAMVLRDGGTDSNRVVVLDSSGNKAADFKLQKKIRGISSKNKSVYLLCDDGLLLSSFDGEQKNFWETGVEALGVAASDAGAYVIDTSSVQRY